MYSFEHLKGSDIAKASAAKQRDFERAGMKNDAETVCIRWFRKWIAATLDPLDGYSPDQIETYLDQEVIPDLQRMYRLGFHLVFRDDMKLPIRCAEDVREAIDRVKRRSRESESKKKIDRSQDLAILEVLYLCLRNYQAAFLSRTRTPDELKILYLVLRSFTKLVHILETTEMDQKNRRGVYLRAGAIAEKTEEKTRQLK